MSWFDKLCRNAGLTIHNASKAFKQEVSEKESDEKKVVKHTVEEEKVNETTVLRRTTIEEIEIKREEEQ